MVGNATYLLLFLKGSFGTHGTPARIQIADKHRWSYKDIYPQGNTLYRIRYLNNRFVAVGEVGTIISHLMREPLGYAIIVRSLMPP